MSRHSLEENEPVTDPINHVPMPDPYDEPPPKDPVESKVVAASGTTLVASLLFALANGYATTDGVLAPLPMWAQFPILLILPPLATFAAGWAKTSNRAG
jgi:hypothetical protein